MTTALLALWTCCVAGDHSSIKAQQHMHRLEAMRRHHLRALKQRQPDIGKLLGIDFPSSLGLYGPAPKVAKREGPVNGSTLATKLFIPPTKDAVKHVPTKAPTTTVPPEQQLCSLNVSDYEIQKFLPLLTQQTGLNIILMTTSQAKVTMHVEKMKLIDVMRHVCALTGFAFLKASDAYVVASPDALKAAYPTEWLAAHPEVPAKQADPPPPVIPPVTQTYVANYIKAAQLVETVKKLVPAGLEVVAGPGQDTPSLANVDPSGKTGQSSVSVTQDTSAGPLSRTVIFRGSAADVASAMQIAKQLDIPRSPGVHRCDDSRHLGRRG